MKSRLDAPVHCDICLKSIARKETEEAIEIDGYFVDDRGNLAIYCGECYKEYCAQ